MPRPEESRTSDENIVLIHPPFRGLRRTGAALAILFGALVLLRLIWGYAASRRLAAKIESIHARHEPFDAADFEMPEVPAEQNVATYLNGAFAAMSPDAESPSGARYTWLSQGRRTGEPLPLEFPPFSDEWHRMASRAMQINANALHLARQARQYTRVRWARQREPGTANPFVMRPLRSSHRLALLLADAAAEEHSRGDDAAAIEYLKDIEHLAVAIGETPAVIDEGTAERLHTLVTARLEMLAPDMSIRIESAPAVSQGSRVPSEKDIVEFIASLLDEQQIHKQFEQCTYSLRAENYDLSSIGPQKSVLLRPMFRLDQLRLLNDCEFLIRAAQQPTWQAADAVCKSRPSLNSSPLPEYVIQLTAVYSTSSSFIERYWNLVAMRRVAATALAVRLYRLRHGDQWPPTLSALVPQMLPAVPQDPRSGQPIGYITVSAGLPGGQPRPLLFCNITKSGSPPGYPVFEWEGGTTEWCDLSRWSWSVPLSATQPSGKSIGTKQSI